MSSLIRWSDPISNRVHTFWMTGKDSAEKIKQWPNIHSMDSSMDRQEIPQVSKNCGTNSITLISFHFYSKSRKKIRSSPSPEGACISNCNESKGRGWRRGLTKGSGNIQRKNICTQWDSKVPLNWCYLLRSHPVWWPSKRGCQGETWLNAAGRGQSQASHAVMTWWQQHTDTHTHKLTLAHQSRASPCTMIALSSCVRRLLHRMTWRCHHTFPENSKHLSKSMSRQCRLSCQMLSFFFISYKVGVPKKRDGRWQESAGNYDALGSWNKFKRVSFAMSTTASQHHNSPVSLCSCTHTFTMIDGKCSNWKWVCLFINSLWNHCFDWSLRRNSFTTHHNKRLTALINNELKLYFCLVTQTERI